MGYCPKTVDHIRLMVKDVWSGPLLVIDDDGAGRNKTVDSDPGSDFRALGTVNYATVWIVRYDSTLGIGVPHSPNLLLYH